MYQIQREQETAGIKEVYQTKSGVTQENHERRRNRPENESFDPVRGSDWSHQGKLWIPAVPAARKSKGDNRDFSDRNGVQHQQTACQETAKEDENAAVQKRFSLTIKKSE